VLVSNAAHICKIFVSSVKYSILFVKVLQNGEICIHSVGYLKTKEKSNIKTT
jgi:hypothetical protein